MLYWAIFPVKTITAKPGEGHQLQTLPIEYMQRGKYQPRKDMNPEKLQELADSIKAQGIIQPVVVRKIAPGKIRNYCRVSAAGAPRNWQGCSRCRWSSRR